MANSVIPVPTDLRVVRTAPDVIEVRFTSVRSDLLYFLRYGPSGEWGDMPGADPLGPIPMGNVAVVPIRLPSAPDASTPPTHFKISARDPALYNPTLSNWWESDSYIYPPGHDGSDNWGQGPGVVVTWGPWVEPAPPPPPVAPPAPPVTPAPAPTEPASSATTTTRDGVRLETAQIGPRWKLPWGTFRILLAKEIP